jgi:hypothetical protein
MVIKFLDNKLGSQSLLHGRNNRSKRSTINFISHLEAIKLYYVSNSVRLTGRRAIKWELNLGDMNPKSKATFPQRCQAVMACIIAFIN